MSLFSFFRNRTEPEGLAPPPERMSSETENVFAARSHPARAPMASSSVPFDNAIAALLDSLDDYLPPPTSSLPAPGVFAATVTERSAGLGNRRGTESRGVFPLIALKGIRLDAVIRFQLWAANPDDAETAMNDLNARLMADRDVLWTSGILKLALESSLPADPIESLSAWRKTADYRLLYEFRYQDSDGAESLIARIPIVGDLEVKDSPDRETTVVTYGMMRWDNEDAPALVVRGPLQIGNVAALAFVPGMSPAGTVTLTRTFDGAAGLPVTHPDVATFLAAVAGDTASERHARVVFPTVDDFLNALSAIGDEVPLGDWDTNGLPDNYQARRLPLAPAIALTNASDRFEIAYQNAAFDQVAVVYLRVT
ncbi:MAG: hypothetical protein ACU83N_13885 [Gammaproteobacteria bacterium]